MKTSFAYYNVLEYLPTRYSATLEQRNDRQVVYNFKDYGTCGSKIFDQFVKVIKSNTRFCQEEYVICFIPASTHSKTQMRYGDLAKRLERETGVRAYVSALKRVKDKASGYLNGKSGNPLEGVEFDSSCFRGKKVILIDDVITRGRTFCLAANELLDRGAVDVIGLFVAKTVNPDWNRSVA